MVLQIVGHNWVSFTFTFMSTESVMLSNHFIFCHPLFLLPSIFPRLFFFFFFLPPVNWLFASDGLSTGASASVLPMNIQGWFPLGLTSLTFLLSKDSVLTCPKSVLHTFICEVPPKELIFSHITFSLGLNLHFVPQSLNSLARQTKSHH